MHFNQMPVLEPTSSGAAVIVSLPKTITVGERTQLVHICLRATSDRDTAEDLAQETMLEALRHWHTLRGTRVPQAALTVSPPLPRMSATVGPGGMGALQVHPYLDTSDVFDTLDASHYETARFAALLTSEDTID